MTSTYTLDEIERIDRAWTDAFAQRKGWEDFFLHDPVDDLDIFFTHLPGTRILDAGCGWGRYVFRFLEKKLDYTGIDYSVEMLKVAQENNPYTRFVEGTCSAMPFSDTHFDGLWSCCSLSGVPKQYLPLILTEYHRVLCTNGTLMVVMPGPGYSDESMGSDETGHSIFQATYTLEEFRDCLYQAEFHVSECAYRYERGSMFFLAKKK